MKELCVMLILSERDRYIELNNVMLKSFYVSLKLQSAVQGATVDQL